LVTQAHKSRIVASELPLSQPQALQLITAGNLICNRFEPLIAGLDLNLTEALTLIAIRDLGEHAAGPTSIAAYIGLKRPSITGYLPKLKMRGLICETAAPGKRPRFKLAAAGVTVVESIDQALQGVEESIKGALPKKEREFLDRKMPRIVSELRWAAAKGWRKVSIDEPQQQANPPDMRDVWSSSTNDKKV
jgi:DNA-binding MarR family transcriptional regulator